MPVRNTSKAAYVCNEANGFNSAKRFQIFIYIKKHGGCSRADISRGLNMPINIVTGRVNDLLEGDFIHEDGCKHDIFSNRSVNCLYVGKAPMGA